jgi:PAS domain-containing protein
MTAAGDDLVWYIATYQAPLRDLQIHGLAMTMILGVSTVALPRVFGLPPVPERRGRRALVLLTLAVAGETTLFILYRVLDNHWLAALLLVPWLMLATAAAMVAAPWRLWRPLPRDDGRSGPFIRAAYAWLAVSLTMLVLMPVYQAVSGITFSHAYYGAIRHAITVGFVSLMILGISSRAVAAFHATPQRALPSLRGPLLLINLGCFLRVTLQTLTDWNPAFYAVVGISGLLELTGLTWWGVGLIRQMSRRRERGPAQRHTAA